jgi:hypothetical protein
VGDGTPGGFVAKISVDDVLQTGEGAIDLGELLVEANGFDQG